MFLTASCDHGGLMGTMRRQLAGTVASVMLLAAWMGVVPSGVASAAPPAQVPSAVVSAGPATTTPSAARQALSLPVTFSRVS